jgi:hypothetical protein
MQERLEAIHGTDWRRTLLANYAVDWTEYTLYWLNAEREGLLDTYHTAPKPGQRALHADESVWFAEKMDEWDPAHHFAEDSNGMFAVVQSNTHISPQRVQEKFAPFFPITIQPYERHIDPALKRAELYSAVVRRGLKILKKMRA